MQDRTYKLGRETDGWVKLYRIVSIDQITVGDVLIKDCHQFQATNLIIVSKIKKIPEGFEFYFVETDGSTIISRVMFDHSFELQYSSYYKVRKDTSHTDSNCSV